MAGTIRRLKRHEIDFARWDAAVGNKENGRIYGLSWWLDAVTESNWEGLVIDDYRVVFPLTFLYRYVFLKLLQRPPFTQQLGPFGELRAGELERLLALIPKSLRRSVPIAGTADLAQIPDGFIPTQRTNLVLDLSPGYPALEAKFSTNLRRHVRRGGSETLSAAATDQYLAVCSDELAEKAGFKASHLAILHNLVNACQVHGYGNCYRFDDGDELLCVGFFPVFAGRVYNLCCASTNAGREREGMARFLARTVQREAGDGKKLDFEGSDLPGVKAFFRKFRPEDEPYWVLR